MLDPINSLHDAMASAIYRDLPDVSYTRLRWKDGVETTEEMKRRPHREEMKVIMFPQLWSNTALGYGGIAGQAFTSAYTIIIVCHDVAYVYFGEHGILAYSIDLNSEEQSEEYIKWIADMKFPDVRTAKYILEGIEDKNE